MRYDDYRRQGLPIMTSAVESVIKQINRRVKGSEKFWSEPGAEAILQLRADYLSETETMSRFWSAREAQAGSGRPSVGHPGAVATMPADRFVGGLEVRDVPPRRRIKRHHDIIRLPCWRRRSLSQIHL